ncbi:MAG: AmmeMemoRadiSam system protein A [Desulfovibrio sp.]|jgi:AmmeMemoRadiSam system protein A|nr:AmmeMemoRadiSam system protein A [Desulfovibrio sp.]
MTLLWAALMPHPPIIIPEVGKGREKEASATLSGAERLRQRVTELHQAGNSPDFLFVLSPHLPYAPGALFINAAPRVTGSLKAFGAPGVAVEAEISDMTQWIAASLRAAGITIAQDALEDISRDHGSLVPLCRLARAFKDGKLPPLVMASPSGLSLQHALLAGRTLAGLTQPKTWALVSSGDLSHRLKPGAPAGFNPDGAIFDRAVVKALESGEPSALMELSPAMRENAGECGLRSVLVLLGLCAAPVEVLSYEGPFGVGYCNALWTPAPAGAAGNADRGGHVGAGTAQGKTTRPAAGHPYALLARLTVERQLSGRPLPSQAEVSAIDPEQALWQERKACFVSIKDKDGSLRGCIGTILPVHGSLMQEIMANAVSAAVRDPRFSPMQALELANVTISVDVLSLPEAVREGMELNPKIWGVIVMQGRKRGVLLPDLPGVNSVEQQIAIAAQKAGINNLDDIQLQRFTVTRYYEG